MRIIVVAVPALLLAGCQSFLPPFAQNQSGGCLASTMVGAAAGGVGGAAVGAGTGQLAAIAGGIAVGGTVGYAVNPACHGAYVPVAPVVYK